MKKTLYLCLCFLGLVVNGWAQPALIGATPNPIPQGYTGNFTLTGSNTQFHVATAGINLKLTHVGTGQIYNFGSAPSGAGWETGFGMTPTQCDGNISIPANAPLGSYNLEIRGYSGYTWAQNLFMTANSFVVVGGTVGFYEGQVVFDADSNCTRNGVDYGLGGRTITATPGPYYGITDAQGNFHMALPLGTYTFSVATPNGLLNVCPVSGSQNATVSTQGATTTGIDFFYKPNHLGDLSSSPYIANHRPGFTNNQAGVTVQNYQYISANNVVAKLVKPSTFTYSGAWYPTPPDMVIGDTAIWNIGTLTPNTSASRYAHITVPIGTPLGTPFSYTSIGTTTMTELYLLNNTNTASAVTVGSYDPNDKQVWTATGANADGFVEPTDSLFRYLIRFQNTGTDTAFNIVIRDTFDADLDIPSLTIRGSSHPMSTQFSDSTGLRMKFIFSNILLADSNTNEPLSHGWVEYTMRKKNGLANGTIISNRASIYFDFNAPVLTNTVNSKICPSLGTSFGSSTNLLVASFTGPTTGGATSWAWNFGDGQTGTGANPSHTYAVGGTYTVCVTVTNACGRTKQICQSITVTCGAIAAGFTFSQGSGFSVSFTNGSTGTVSGVQWTFGDGGTSTQSNPSHTYTNPGTYTVCLIITNVCADQDTVCHTVVVACPPMNSAFTYGPLSSTNVSFTNSSTGMYSGVQWLFGDGGGSSVTNPTHTYTTPGLYTVCLILTNLCGTQDTSCSTLAVGCATAVNASYSGSMTFNVGTFTDQSQGTNLSYLWDFGDGSTSTFASPTHTFLTVGSFQVCLTVTDVCLDDATVCSTFTVQCIAPTSAFTASVAANVASFTDQSTSTPTWWSWDFGDGGVSTLQHPTHAYATPGVYPVCLTATNSCGANVYCENVTVGAVGISGPEFGSIMLQPNPASDHVLVRITQASLQDVQFRLCDALGRVVNEWAAPEIHGDYAHDLDVTPQAAGVYFLRIEAEGVQQVLRLVIN